LLLWLNRKTYENG